jgi:hypothetical protein
MARRCWRRMQSRATRARYYECGGIPLDEQACRIAKAFWAMEFNRNQYFMAGLVIFLLGIQLRLVDGFVLNERTTQVLAQRMQRMRGQQVASSSEATTLLASLPPGHKHRLSPPKWLGWSLVSVGSVLILYSLALKRPGG